MWHDSTHLTSQHGPNLNYIEDMSTYINYLYLDSPCSKYSLSTVNAMITGKLCQIKRNVVFVFKVFDIITHIICEFNIDKVT